MGKVRERDQGQGVSACLDPVERNDIVNETATTRLFALRGGTLFDGASEVGPTGTSQ
jgi:hypothetical protein